MFDPLYRYDYLARPHKIVPNTAAALPEIVEGRQGRGRSRSSRASTSPTTRRSRARSASSPPPTTLYSWKRIARPEDALAAARTRSTARFVGMDALLAKAKETGKFDYDAPVEGLQLVDKYTLQLKLNGPYYDLLSDLTSTGVGRGRARSRRGVRRRQRLGHGQPGRHRAVSAEGVAARAEDRARGEPVVPRSALSREQRPRRQAIMAKLQGQALAADRQDRDLGHRGSEPAPAGVRAAASSTTSRCRSTWSPTCSSRTTS